MGWKNIYIYIYTSSHQYQLASGILYLYTSTWYMLLIVQFAHRFYLVCAFFVSCIFRQPNFVYFCDFSDLPRALWIAPLCDHGLLRQRVNVRTTTTTTYEVLFQEYQVRIYWIKNSRCEIEDLVETLILAIYALCILVCDILPSFPGAQHFVLLRSRFGFALSVLPYANFCIFFHRSSFLSS